MSSPHKLPCGRVWKRHISKCREDCRYNYYNVCVIQPHSPPTRQPVTQRSGRGAAVPRRTARPLRVRSGAPIGRGSSGSHGRHKSKPGTPSGETRGRASRYRLWLPDGPLVRLVIRCRDTDYCPDGPDCEAVCASMNSYADLEIRCPYLPLEV